MTDTATLIQNRDKLAQSVAAEAQAYLNTLANLNTGLTVPNIFSGGVANPIFSGVGANAIATIQSSKPTAPARLDFPNGTTPTLADFAPSPEPFVPATIAEPGDRPALNFPSLPQSFSAPTPVEPSITAVAIPARPGYTLPTAPTVSQINLPTIPLIDIPVFAATPPTITLDPPSFSFAFAEEVYSSALLDPLKSKLLNYLENGGFGMNETDEQRLFDRTRDRAQKTAAANMERVRGEIAASGFDFPPGALIAAQQQSIEEMNNLLSEANRDITLRRSELYVENERFTIGEVRALESVLMQFHAGRMERALNAAKSLADVGRSLFEMQVARHNSLWDAYKSAGQFFEIRVRAEVAKLEAYKTQMDGKRLEVEIQGKQVDVYQAQLQGIKTIQEIYKADIEAALVVEQTNRTRLEAFRARIDAYAAQARVKELEFSAYRAGIDGETAKVSAYRSEVEAYTAKVNAEKAKADMKSAEYENGNKRAQLLLERFKAEVAQYQANIGFQLENIKLLRDNYQADVSAYTAVANALAQALKVSIAETEANNTAILAATKERLAQSVAVANSFLAQAGLQKNIAVAGAQIYSDRIAAVQNTLQALISQSSTA